MPSLSETQAEFRMAVVANDGVIPATLVAPAPLAGRLAIYRRHFREALVRHLAGRFPTVEWLLGTDRFVSLAEPFIRTSPPSTPCMAEYGAGFADVLEQPGLAGSLPYLADIARLDWILGDAAVAIDLPPVGIGALSAWPADRLPDLRLRLQPGVSYLRSDWPIDDLVRVRLDEAPPDRLEFNGLPVALEIHGARGQFGIGRMDPGAFAFRSALREGATLGAAIERALSTEPEFDVSAAIGALFAAELVVEVLPPHAE
jgi:hypothetical protein